MTTFAHTPVLLDEVCELFAAVPGGIVVDGTLGGGGHSEALLAARSDRRVIGIDRDPEARAAAARRLDRFGDRAIIVAATSDEGLARAAAEGPVVGVLLDLGVSSPQIDRAARGFSYRQDGPLDMRMDPTVGRSAAELLDDLDADELAALLRRFADEPHARRIARSVIGARPVRTTDQLAAAVRDAVPAAVRRRGDPAKRTFQALRIAVNDELDLLERTLDRAIEAVAPGGRVVVISYHSGEDRLVKHRFRQATDPYRHLPRHLPPPPGATPTHRALTRRAVVAGADEQGRNPRSASARLRAIERLPEDS